MSRTSRLRQPVRAGAVVATAAVLAACGEPPSPPVAPPVTPQVSYLVVQPQRLPVSIDLAGRTAPVLIAEVRPQVSGLIRTRQFTEGADVKAGALLYQIDSATYVAAVDRARASLARSEAAVGVAKLKARRTAELVAIKAVSQQDEDDAKSALAQAQADVLSARAQLETVRIDLDRTRVTAPISGRIGRSMVTPGALVTASQQIALATVQKLDPIHVDLTQSSTETLLLKRLLAEGKVQPGNAKVKIVFEDGTIYPLEGKLQFSEVSVDQGTGSVTLRAEVPNPKAQLLPGMYVRASVEAGVIDAAILIPQQAVTRDNAGNASAYVIGPDSKLALRTVVPRRAIGTQWLISEGLNPGDRLAVQGQENAKPGAVVTPVVYKPAAPASAASGAAAAASGAPSSAAVASGAAGKS